MKAKSEKIVKMKITFVSKLYVVGTGKILFKHVSYFIKRICKSEGTLYNTTQFVIKAIDPKIGVNDFISSSFYLSFLSDMLSFNTKPKKDIL
jgi:hypothetical protein